MLNTGWRILTVSLLLALAACSSAESERQEKLASCEQVKDFDDIYQECLNEANE
jgi:hypothetical protein